MQPVVLSIGNFDGLHLGHQYLLQKNIDLASHLKAKSGVLSFYPHPLQILRPNEIRYPLSNSTEQELGLENLGMDEWIREPFTQKIKEESPQAFMERLIHSVPVAAIVVGPDFRFGKNREGNVQSLAAMAAALHFQVVLPDAYLYQGQRVSSSLIRQSLQKGEMEQANDFLGRPFALCGKVISGFRRGRGVGFPTANIKSFPAHNLRRGVYSTVTSVQGQRWKSATNIGLHPTFEEASELQVETHLLDFSENIYGENIKIEFMQFLRPEIKFKDVETLKNQIHQDIQLVRER